MKFINLITFPTWPCISSAQGCLPILLLDTATVLPFSFFYVHTCVLGVKVFLVSVFKAMNIFIFGFILDIFFF